MYFGSIHAADIFAVEIHVEFHSGEILQSFVIVDTIGALIDGSRNKTTSLFVIRASHDTSKANVTDSAQSFGEY
jgi:hypothetical protein